MQVKRENPPEWQVFLDNTAKVREGQFAEIKSVAACYRFRARYRAALLYQGTNFVSMGGDTAQGYSSFSRLMFSYSAFEYFLGLIGVKQSQCLPIIEQFKLGEWAKEIRELDADGGFFGFILNFVNNTHKAEIKNFKDGLDFNFTYLASAVRHAFAHGCLTPNAGGVDPKVAKNVCDNLSDKLFVIMDHAFFQIMQRLKVV